MNLSKKILSSFKITRPVNFLITFFTVIVASVICVNESYSIAAVLCAALSASFAASAGNIINDIVDVEIDSLNKPQRPLPSGSISKDDAIALYILSVLISILMAAFVNFTAFIVAVSANLILFIYSVKLKSVPLLGNSVVALMTGLTFIYGGIAVDSWRDSLIPAFFALLINFIREIVKDMQDVEGDSANGIFTFPKKFGFEASKNLIFFTAVVLIISTIYPFVMHYYKIEYLIIILVVVNPVLIFALFSLSKNHSNKNLGKVSFILKLNMIFGLAAIYLGR